MSASTEQHAPSTSHGRAVPSPLRILVLHQHYWPEIAATAQILTDLCEDLAAAGHEVTVVCGAPSYRVVPGAVVEAPPFQRRGVRIVRVPSYRPATRTIPQRLLHYASYFVSSLGAALTQSKPDVCLIMSTPPLLLGVSGMLIEAIRDVPFVYSVQDLYPDIAIHLGVLPASGPLPRAVDRVATACYRGAAAVVTLSSAMAQRLEAKGVVAPYVIPNWADTGAVRPLPRDNAFAREHGLADGFVVQYAGNLGMSQGLESLLDAAEELQGEPVSFALVGDGNARAELVRAVADRRLGNVRFLPPQPRERLPELLASSDVGVVTMKRGVAADLVPSKLYGIMAAGRPVLASVEEASEVHRVVTRHACGFVVPPEDGHALAMAVRKALTMPRETLAMMGERGAQACAEQYSRPRATASYLAVLQAAANVRR